MLAKKWFASYQINIYQISSKTACRSGHYCLRPMVARSPLFAALLISFHSKMLCYIEEHVRLLYIRSFLVWSVWSRKRIEGECKYVRVSLFMYRCIYVCTYICIIALIEGSDLSFDLFWIIRFSKIGILDRIYVYLYL